VKASLICAVTAAVATALLLPAAASAIEFLPREAGFEANVYAEGEQAIEIAREAGSHPIAMTFDVDFQTDGGGLFTPDDLRELSFELPPGLIEDPTAIQTCSQAAFHTPRDSPWEESLSGESCQDKSQVGIATVRSSFGGGTTRTFGVFNLSPPPGAPSQLGLNAYGSPIIFVPTIRQAEGEYGITLEAENVPQHFGISGLTLTLWGTPWSVRHNEQRGNCLRETEPAFGWAKCSVGRPANPEHKPSAYLTLPTTCEEPLRFTASARSWQEPGSATATDVHPQPLEGCGALTFEPVAGALLSNPRASSPSGYRFDIDVDTGGVTDPARLAPSPLRKAVVTLPRGVTINPSVGAGLGVCTQAQYAAETPTSTPGAGCPNESKIGEFEVRSPIVAGSFEGSIFLAAPRDNPFGGLLAIYLVAKSIQRGILVKVAGELKADPTTGSLTATFDKLPQLPYSQLSIRFREGQRSPLATPAACGPISTEVLFTPWRDPSEVVPNSLPASITSGKDGAPCPAGPAPFAPQASGGTLNSQAGAYSPFYLHLRRQANEQEIVSYSAQLPPGLLGKIAGVPYCAEAAIEAARQRSGVAERDDPSCPAASLIGHTTAGYGVGSVLAYAPGNLYLAGPYRGSSFSVVAIDSALVGPFDLGVVIVRSAIRIDPQTAQASIDATGTDPIPHILDGIPIHLRDVRVYVDRPSFTINPTSCAPRTLASALNGAGQRFGDRADDTLFTARAHFQAANCSALGFKPRIGLRVRGKTRRGAFPSLRVVVRPRPGQANIASAAVTLPRSLFLDQSRIETICTKAQFAADRCPPDSIYGRVRAFTPLLEAPMEGPAYLRSSDNTLPDLVFALRGQGIEIDLAGRIDSFKGGIRGTFPVLPDAPVTKFVLRMEGGRQGVIVNAAELCAGKQVARARFLGHANRGWRLRPALQARCKERKERRDKGRGDEQKRGGRG
jgi:hypothetical protein